MKGNFKFLTKALAKHTYKKPSVFVRGILNKYPTEDQAKALDELADLLIQRFIVHAPRGVGKSEFLADLSAWSVSEIPKMTGQPYGACILGGKWEQAKRVHKTLKDWFTSIPYLQEQLEREPVQGLIPLKNGKEITALKASEKSVHSPHTDAIFIDEAGDCKTGLIKEAFQIPIGSEYPRWGLTSTPYTYGEDFLHYLRNAKRLGFKKYWFKSENCPWISDKDREKAKEEYDDAFYRIQYLGLPAIVTSIIFNPEHLKIASEEIEEPKIGGRIHMGIDHGFGPSPTAVIIVYNVADVWYVALAEEYLHKTPEWIHEKIKSLYKRYKPQMIFADAQQKAEIMRLREAGIPVRSTGFQYRREIDMVPRIQRMLKGKRLKINQKWDDLLKQMGMMSYSLDRQGRPTSKRLGVDLVDALLLALSTEESTTSQFGIVVDKYEIPKREILQG